MSIIARADFPEVRALALMLENQPIIAMRRRASMRPAWPRGFDDMLATGTALYALLYCLGLLVGWRETGLPQQAVDLVFMPICAATVLLTWRAPAGEQRHPSLVRGWRLVSAAYATVFASHVAHLVTAGHSSGMTSWISLLFYPLVLTGIVTVPLGMRTGTERAKFWLDASTVIVGGFVATWYAVMHTARSGPATLDRIMLVMAYPLGDLLLLLILGSLLLRRVSRQTRSRLLLLSGALVASGLGDVAYALGTLSNNYATGRWPSVCFMLAYVFVAAAAADQRRHASHAAPDHERTSQSRVQPFSALPYLALATGYSLLAREASADWSTPISGLVIGAITLTVLVVARQIAAVRENARLSAERAATESESRFRSLVQHSSDAITVVDVDTTVRFASPSVTRMFDIDAESLIGVKLSSLVHPDDMAQVVTFIADAAASAGLTSPLTWRLRRDDASWAHVESLATNLLDDPTVGGLVLNTRDVSERWALEEQLTHQAFHDHLTGLANRALFRNRVEHALAGAGRTGHPVAVLFLDLDNFKTVNDSLGHAEGDRLLNAAATRLLGCVRESDTVARFGGDEFAILLETRADEAAAVHVAERVADALRHPLPLEGKEVFLSTSIGIARSSAADGTDELLRNADVAMYMAKSRGKGRHEIFEPQMHEVVLDRLDLEADLRRAIDQEQLDVHFQPIVNLIDGSASGLEALVRWNHPERGMTPPSAFIPLAEETGLIVPLGRWVLNRACHAAKRWQVNAPTGPALTITVNISGRQVQDSRIVADVAAALATSGLPANTLVLELTESVLMQNTEATLARLRELKRLGVRLAIDDFGTGYSSLGYLQRFPIDVLKIAKSFVDGVVAGTDGSALARAIIALADTLRLRTVAEGIETAEQWEQLRDFGCELGQGYHFARPLPEADVDAYLRRPRGGAIASA